MKRLATGKDVFTGRKNTRHDRGRNPLRNEALGAIEGCEEYSLSWRLCSWWMKIVFEETLCWFGCRLFPRRQPGGEWVGRRGGRRSVGWMGEWVGEFVPRVGGVGWGDPIPPPRPFNPAVLGGVAEPAGCLSLLNVMHVHMVRVCGFGTRCVKPLLTCSLQLAIALYSGCQTVCVRSLSLKAPESLTPLFPSPYIHIHICVLNDSHRNDLANTTKMRYVCTCFSTPSVLPS